MTVYADNAATTRMSDAALEAVNAAMREHWGNPSSIHATGQDALKVLDAARAQIAGLIGAEPREIYFTSGGTEADNWAITSLAALGASKNKKHVVSTKFEHHAVLHVLKRLAKQGFEITYLDVNANGIVKPGDVAAAIREDTALVTIMYANNEVGTIQPITAIGEICDAKNVPFHTDAVQAVGHLPVDVHAQKIDALSLSAHKFHGPKGVGAMYYNKRVRLNVFQEGGAQERGKRGGTENVPGIAGMAAALAESVSHMQANADKTLKLRDRLIEGIRKIEKILVNGEHAPGDAQLRLPGNVNVCFEGIEGESLLLLLDMDGIRGSSGSACTSGSLDPSHVLLALGLPHGIAHGSLRLSLSEYNTDADADYILEKLPPIVQRLREMSPLWTGNS